MISKKISGLLAGVFLTTSVIATSVQPAQAMEIREYDNALSDEDQSRFIAHLVDGTIDALYAEGKEDMGNKAWDLFMVDQGDGTSVGIWQLHHNLDLMRALDQKRGDNGKRVHVEYAMLYTLKNNGIDAPRNIMTIASDFEPSDDQR
jgi:hypothetical protein